MLVVGVVVQVVGGGLTVVVVGGGLTVVVVVVVGRLLVGVGSGLQSTVMRPMVLVVDIGATSEPHVH